ncbi:MAG TPA: MarR family transcriptional regulator [Bryobacteraceae bacterium]|nr:MarR family transcriptional regulator [Bryobacteraceae bacterium]
MDALSRGAAHVLRAEDISMTQYNVLRILRGSPEGLSCGEVGHRMITREPDITRLLERLEKRKLIARRRDPDDRRTVIARVTPLGLAVLDRLDGPVQDIHRTQLGHLGPKRLKALIDLLTVCRSRLD